MQYRRPVLPLHLSHLADLLPRRGSAGFRGRRVPAIPDPLPGVKPFRLRALFTSDNGLTPLVFTDIQQYFLAFAVYDDTLEPLIQQGEGPAYRLRDSDAAACLRQLLWDAVYTRTEAPAQLPPEEPIILKLGDERQLSFWPDSDLTLLKNWGAVQYYHGGGSLAQLCLEAARAAG